MTTKKRKQLINVIKFILAVVVVLVLGVGSAAVVSNLLTKRQTVTNNVSPPQSSTNKELTNKSPTNKESKVEPEVVDKQKKETIPEQGKVDKKPESQPEQNKTSQAPAAQQPAKLNEKLVDPFIENYLNIYVNLSNDSELEFYYLDNMIVKNSIFYKTLTEEIQKLRQAKIKYVLDDFKVENIAKGENESELIVQVSQTINKKTTKYSYIIYFDKNGVFIKNRKS